MKKSSGRVILQILSAVLGSVLFSVSVFLMILGESITALVLGLAAAVYLTARVLAAAKEKDKNGPLNIFAVVFIILLCLLCLISIKELPLATDEGKTEETASAVPSTAVVTETPSSGKTETAEESSSSVPTGTQTTETLQQQLRHPSPRRLRQRRFRPSRLREASRLSPRASESTPSLSIRKQQQLQQKRKRLVK